MRNRHSPFYRIMVILVVYAFLGLIVLLPIAATQPVDYLLLWIVVGIWGASLIATVLISEISHAKKKKKEKDGHDS